MNIACSNLDSALRPVPHDPSMPAPLPPENSLVGFPDKMVVNKDSSSVSSCSIDFVYEPEENMKPTLFSQQRLNDLIKNLALY